MKSGEALKIAIQTQTFCAYYSRKSDSKLTRNFNDLQLLVITRISNRSFGSLMGMEGF